MRVIVLFCYADDGSRFLRTAYEAGLGGEGFLWLGSDSFVDEGLWVDDAVLALDTSARERVLKGFFSLSSNTQPGWNFSNTLRVLCTTRTLP